MARSAIRSLSYSEVLAMQHIFDEFDGDEGLLVASRIADQAGITRSVIVNALASWRRPTSSSPRLWV